MSFFSRPASSFEAIANELMSSQSDGGDTGWTELPGSQSYPPASSRAVQRELDDMQREVDQAVAADRDHRNNWRPQSHSQSQQARSFSQPVWQASSRIGFPHSPYAFPPSPPLIRPIPIRPTPRQPPLPTPTLLPPTPCRFAPLQPSTRAGPSLPGPSRQQFNIPAPPKSTSSRSFPTPLNVNIDRRKDEHLPPEEGISRFETHSGGNYESRPSFGSQANRGAENAGRAPLRYPSPGEGKESVRPLAPKGEAIDDEDLFGEAEDDAFEQALAAVEESAWIAPRNQPQPPRRDPAPHLADRKLQADPFRPRNAPANDYNPGGPAGVRLLPVSILPDRYRSIWKFGVFNAVQSTCFETIYQSDENVVVSAPTGSGKTALFELAILRLFSTTTETDVKVVYMAPTKSLCSERARDWKTKFAPLGWNVIELTGDSTLATSKEIGSASVIVTTPEKWDVISRRWNSNRKTLDQLRLFLYVRDLFSVPSELSSQVHFHLRIDECHFVGMDVRGAVLEVVVSRMKTLGTDTRFLALSATAPNVEDIATWLGPSDDDAEASGAVAAKVFKFGDEFRPCRLHKVVVGYQKSQNDFVFNQHLNTKLFDLIKAHSSGKPVLIFVSTRKGCSQAAEVLAKEYRAKLDSNRPGTLPWPNPRRNAIKPLNKTLAALADCGIAFHHAGLEMSDRRYVEQGFIAGTISAVCATSTLAIGVNLPCRMVIIKGTTRYIDGRFAEYTSSEIVQMMGRAGRPQFDTVGVACIMTERDLQRKYEDLAKSETLLESCLHKTLTEHINSEITLGTINDIHSALLWLRSTFLNVRIKKKPRHYALEGDSSVAPEVRLEELCLNAVQELVKEGIVYQSEEGRLGSTEFGDIMSRYYLSSGTFSMLKSIPPKATMRTLLETLSGCAEFSSIRFRPGEKTAFANQNKSLTYPCAKMATAADKIMVIIQLVLECVPLQEVKTVEGNPSVDSLLIFQHAPRIVRAMVDLALEKRDAGVKVALELLRSVNARAWDGSPFILRQIEGIGQVSVKALADRNITSFQDIYEAEPSRLELILNRNPPFGRKLIAQAKLFPRFTLDVSSSSDEVGPRGVTVNLQVEVALAVTDPTPVIKKGGKFAASILLTSSDNEFIEYRRVRSDYLLQGPKSFTLAVVLVKPSRGIIATVSCDDLAGSEVRVAYKPSTAASLYPIPAIGTQRQPAVKEDVDMDFEDVKPPKNLSLPRPKSTASKPAIAKITQEPTPKAVKVPVHLPNGNWACNHACGDKTQCRHLCCREGLAKPPAPSRKKSKKAACEDDDDEELPTSKSNKDIIRHSLVLLARRDAQAASSSKPKPKPQPKPKALVPVPATSSTLASFPKKLRRAKYADSTDEDAFPSMDELLMGAKLTAAAVSSSTALKKSTSSYAPKAFKFNISTGDDGDAKLAASGKRSASSNSLKSTKQAPVDVDLSDEDEEERAEGLAGRGKAEDDEEEIDELDSPTPSPPIQQQPPPPPARGTGPPKRPPSRADLDTADQRKRSRPVATIMGSLFRPASPSPSAVGDVDMKDADAEAEVQPEEKPEKEEPAVTPWDEDQADFDRWLEECVTIVTEKDAD